ncbi:MAG: hypothetical protein DMG69_00925 [Acidobacteria bacterium]|nr:MAG: hypothetical protein DMG69_00925 [Acidobacteriota bacterium]
MERLSPANNRYLAQHDIQLVEQFLTEISGLQSENNVFLVGADPPRSPGRSVLG